MKLNKEILITFDEVRQYLLLTCKNISFKQYRVTPIIDAVEPFVMDYIQHPYGFAETDNLNSKSEIIEKLDENFLYLLIGDGRSVNGRINRMVKIENRAWEQRNGRFYARYIGRLAYLLNEERKSIVC